MKKFQFTLNKLWTFKMMQLDKEKLTLAGMHHQKHELDQKIALVQAQYDFKENDFKETIQRGTTAEKIRGSQFQINNLRRHLEGLFKEKSSLKSMIKKQLALVVSLSKEVSQLESLHEKQLEEYRVYQTKAEEIRIEEFIASTEARKKAI